eukprot:scaffold26367_cov15-Tisochrysis_lutea.AAC.2
MIRVTGAKGLQPKRLTASLGFLYSYFLFHLLQAAEMRRKLCNALGKLKVTLAANSGSKGDAAGVDLLSAKVTGDPMQQGLLTWEGRVPDDVTQ